MGKLSAGKGKHKVTLESLTLGNDTLIVLTGGEQSHIGAVAVALPYKQTASSSVITLPGHKDGDLARPIAEIVAKNLKKKVIVVAGIHIDNATEDDIDKLMENSHLVTTKFIRVGSK